MNRTPRRGRLPPVPRRNDSLNRFKQGLKPKISAGIEVLHPPHPPLKISLRKSRSKQKNAVNRCCFVSPETKNFGQYYAVGKILKDTKDSAAGSAQLTDPEQLQFLLKEQYNFEPRISAIKHPEKSKKVSRDSHEKDNTTAQCADPRTSKPPKKPVFDESHWKRLESPEDVDSLNTNNDSKRPSKHIFISDVPRVKVIAEKFSKYKRGDLELRRLDEKVVCVEYDIFNQSSNHEVLKPVQKMRTFFSMKPLHKESSENKGHSRLPPIIKNKFDVLEEDLEQFTEKEIEFIDNDIEENQSYLDDLRRILKRKEVMKVHQPKTTLDLQCLYEMARRDGRLLKTDFSNTNLLTKAELQEVKQLILKRCTSSVHGFRRRTIKKKAPALDPGVISDNLMSEVLRNQT